MIGEYLVVFGAVGSLPPTVNYVIEIFESCKSFITKTCLSLRSLTRGNYNRSTGSRHCAQRMAHSDCCRSPVYPRTLVCRCPLSSWTCFQVAAKVYKRCCYERLASHCSVPQPVRGWVHCTLNVEGSDTEKVRFVA